MNITSTDPVEQFIIEVHNLRTVDGKICNYHIGLDLQDEIRIAKILVEKMIAHYLEHSGQYVTNDATREAAIREAVAAEREACLKACEQIAAKYYMKRYATDWQAQECIAAIKARGES